MSEKRRLHSLMLLCKLSKRQLDSLVLEEKALEQERHAVYVKLYSYERAVQDEFQCFVTTELSHSLKDYLEFSNSAIDALRFTIDELNDQLIVVAEKLRQAFSEFKRYELIVEKKKKELLIEQNIADAKTIDELSTTNYLYTENI